MIWQFKKNAYWKVMVYKFVLKCDVDGWECVSGGCIIGTAYSVDSFNLYDTK